jgi:hypothetical protein
MWSGFNKRRFPRCDVELELNIAVDKQVKYIATRTENLGVGGLCFLLDVPLEPFTEVSLKFPLDDDHVPIQCNGRVMWIVEKHGTSKKDTRFDIGVEFINISAEDQNRIERLLTKQKG